MESLVTAYPPAAWAALLATGILIGLLAGLLGVGGGIVAVPILLEIFEFQGIAEPQAVPLAVGTVSSGELTCWRRRATSASSSAIRTA